MKLEAFLNPQSIAVVGASREPEKVGHKIFRNLIDSRFRGVMYPINPKATEILGYKCYRSVREVPDNVDLAVIAVPAQIVPTVAEECGMSGVKGITVISAGFSETGGDGTHLERELVAICRKYNMRMQGPNCLGIVNARNFMNASFAAANPLPGSISFISQSGALGSTILNWAFQNGIGFASFISLGNEADLEAADFLEALAEDDMTRVIGLYIEGVKSGEHFINIAKEVTRKKPVIALKAGTTDVGIRAVSSHTGSLAGSDTAFSAAFKKANILRANTLEELFHLVLAFGAQPIPKGKNVLVITNGGGPGILAADACEKMNLDLPALEYELMEKLRNALPPHASLHNPVDLLGDADENRYGFALYAALQSGKVDGVIVILTPQAMTPADKVADIVVEAKKRFPDKPLLAVFMGLDDDSYPIKTLLNNNIPNYVFPESAAYVFGAMHDYSLILGSPREDVSKILKADDEQIKEVLAEARKDGRVNLTIEESIKVAKACGIRLPHAMMAKNRKEAAEIARTIGYPVVMKIISPEILHKTDLGGVILNVNTRKDVERNYELILRKTRMAVPEAGILGVLIQQMVPLGREAIVGAVRDPQFGPLMMFGLGGIYVNFLRDVSYRLCPLTKSESREMVEETKAYALLRGVRGEPPSDINSVVDVILRVSQVMTRFKEIVEMEINPLRVYEEGNGYSAVDIRMTISK